MVKNLLCVSCAAWNVFPINSLLLGSYYTYCSDLWWIVLFIFITALLFLLYVLFEKKVECTFNCYYCTALPIIRTVLKKQAWNIHKHLSYNRKLRVVNLNASKTLVYFKCWPQKVVFKSFHKFVKCCSRPLSGLGHVLKWHAVSNTIWPNFILKSE